jgi:hypothetical protein
MPSITLYFKHFACQYFIFRNENAKKTETAHRQKLSTYRETPCKVTKSALKTKKITHIEKCVKLHSMCWQTWARKLR